MNENNKQPVGAEGARGLADKELEAVSGGWSYTRIDYENPVCPSCGKSDMIYWEPAAHEYFCKRCMG